MLHVSDDQRAEAEKDLSEFVGRCQRLFFAFGGLGEGRTMLHEHYKKTLDPKYRDVDMTLAYQTNSDPNSIEISPIASMKQGELIDATADGGEFENLTYQAFLVFVYHLWEEHYRTRVARKVGLSKKKRNWIRCDLMGDVGQLRHAVIHRKAAVKADALRRMVMIPAMWGLETGPLYITRQMMEPLMERFNNIELRVEPPTDPN